MLFHGAQCRSCDFDFAGSPIFERDPYGTEVGKLPTLRFVVRVGHVVSCQGTFSGYVTSSCHYGAFLMGYFLWILTKN